MSIQIRKPKNPRGNLSVYRKTYVKARDVRGVHVPGHVAVDYVGKLPRFGTVDKLTYTKPEKGPAPEPLNPDERKVLQMFLDEDSKNWFASWPKDLVLEIETAVRAEFMDSVEPQSHLDVLASTIRGATMDIEHEAKLFREQGQVLAEGWGNDVRKTDAPGENELTQLKARVNEVRQAFKEFVAGAQAAGLVVARPREGKKGGGK